MEETKHTFADDEGEETMVTPRFDDEETVLARPVVPFEEVSDSPDVAAAPTTAAPPLYSRLREKPRRSLVAALVLVSALVGSVLGVAGLYFYQNHKSADARPTEQQQAEAPAAQPTSEPASETKGRETDAHAAAQPSAPAAAEPEARNDEVADSIKGKGSDDEDDRAVVERRNVSETPGTAATTKRGKKGARDEEIQRGAQRAPRYDDEDERPVVRDDDRDDDRREARRVGVITYRPRRARPRRDRYDTPDRLRRIFEGQP